MTLLLAYGRFYFLVSSLGQTRTVNFHQNPANRCAQNILMVQGQIDDIGMSLFPYPLMSSTQLSNKRSPLGILFDKQRRVISRLREWGCDFREWEKYICRWKEKFFRVDH
jgi:hypothetical protein